MARSVRALLMTVVLAAFPIAGDGATWTTDGLDDYWITRWERTDGAPAGLIVALAQDRDGFLWLGTAEGLYRYDGFSFQRWADLSSGTLAGTSVRSLFIDRAGTLWVGFDDGGISRVSGTQLRNYSVQDGLPDTGVRVFAQDSAGTMWAGTGAGLFSLDGVRWTLSPPAAALPVEPIAGAMHDATGRFFVATTRAVYRRRARAAAFDKVLEHPVEARPTQALCTDSHGHVMTTDPLRGFRLVEPVAGHAEPTTSGIGVKISCGRDGTVWVGTVLTGLWRVDGTDSTHRAAPVRTGLLEQAAFAILQDRDQNLWVGTNNGVYRLTPRNVRTLGDTVVPTSIVSGGTDRMWVGTVDGLLQFTLVNGSWRRTRHSLDGQQIRSVHVDGSGVVWTATSDGVLRQTRSGALEVPPWGRDLRRVRAMTSNPQGALWLYDESQGLFRVREGRLEPLEVAPDLRARQFRRLHMDRRGRLWLVSDGGVEVRGEDGDVRRFTTADGLAQADYRSIYEDEDGIIWLGSTAGLSRLGEGRIETVTLGRVNRTAWVKTIIDDRQGQLWLGLDRGGVRLSRAAFQDAARSPGRALVDGFEIFDDLPGSIRGISDRVAARASNGHLWFTTDEGVAIVDPDVARPALGLVPARLTGVRVDDAEVDPGTEVRLGAGPRRLAIGWSAVDLTTPDRVRFRYRLDGHDQTWVDAGTAREAEYTNLAPGSYVFRLAAAREGSPWTESGPSWAFTVAPHVYQTVWFPFALALLVAAGAWAVWHARLVQARRRFAITLQERARVSRDVHDTLLQSLVGVALQCQALASSVESPALRERLVRLRRRVDEHIEEARELIWNLRSPTLERHDLAAALHRAAEGAVEGTGVGVELQTHGAARACPPRVAQELLRIGQEAIFNAVRHGRPSLVRVELHFDPEAIRLRVTDDGSGFTPGATLAAADRHCGLPMMSERAAEVGGTVSIRSEPGCGTSVEATVPLEQPRAA